MSGIFGGGGGVTDHGALNGLSDDDHTQYQQNPATGGHYSNLVIENNATNPNYQLDISADALLIEGVMHDSFSATVDITTSGANGLDTGSEAANTWYYVWAIAKADGTTASLLSTSSTSPTLPSGYTKKRRVGAVRNDASSNFLQFVQEGNVVSYLKHGAQTALSLGQATTFTDVDFSSYVPTTSRKAIVQKYVQVRHSVADVAFDLILRRNGDTFTNGRQYRPTRNPVANNLHADTTEGVVPLDSSQLAEYKILNAPNVSGGCTLDVMGYYDRI